MNNSRRKRLEKIGGQMSILAQELKEIHEEEYDAYENLPENLQNSIKAEAMEDGANMILDCADSLEDLIDDIDAVINL